MEFAAQPAVYRDGLLFMAPAKHRAMVTIIVDRIGDTLERWLIFWTAGREVRIGPLTRDQAEKLAEDLSYDAVDL